MGTLRRLDDNPHHIAQRHLREITILARNRADVHLERLWRRPVVDQGGDGGLLQRLLDLLLDQVLRLREDGGREAGELLLQPGCSGQGQAQGSVMAFLRRDASLRRGLLG